LTAWAARACFGSGRGVGGRDVGGVGGWGGARKLLQRRAALLVGLVGSLGSKVGRRNALQPSAETSDAAAVAATWAPLRQMAAWISCTHARTGQRGPCYAHLHIHDYVSSPPRTAPRICWNDAGELLVEEGAPLLEVQPTACCPAPPRPFPLVLMPRELACDAFCANRSKREVLDMVGIHSYYSTLSVSRPQFCESEQMWLIAICFGYTNCNSIRILLIEGEGGRL